jgi:hypothetical protein
VLVSLGATVGFQKATLAAVVGAAATLDVGAVSAAVVVMVGAAVGAAVVTVAPVGSAVVTDVGRASLPEHAESMVPERPMAARYRLRKRRIVMASDGSQPSGS